MLFLTNLRSNDPLQSGALRSQAKGNGSILRDQDVPTRNRLKTEAKRALGKRLDSGTRFDYIPPSSVFIKPPRSLKIKDQRTDTEKLLWGSIRASRIILRETSMSNIREPLLDCLLSYRGSEKFSVLQTTLPSGVEP